MADEPYFTDDELCALPDMEDVLRFPDERRRGCPGLDRGAIERECGHLVRLPHRHGRARERRRHRHTDARTALGP